MELNPQNWNVSFFVAAAGFPLPSLGVKLATSRFAAQSGKG
jgi:hypothetical protein